MKDGKRYATVTPNAVAKYTAFLSNTAAPMLTYEEMSRKAIEMGFDPKELIDATLGSIKYEKSGARLGDPLEDTLNEIYKDSPTPSDKFIIDPNAVKSNKGKVLADELGFNKGVAIPDSKRGSIEVPSRIIVRDAKSDLGKLKAIANAGHEIQHPTDFLVRPDLQYNQPKSYKKGHHFKGIYEPDEAIREAKNIAPDAKEIEQVRKASKALGLKPSPFKKILSILGHVGPIGVGIGALSALRSGDVPAAVLHGASAIDPTGIANTALEVNSRLKMSPEDAAQASKEDFYSAMPIGLGDEQRMLDEVQEPRKPRFQKLKERLK